MPLSRRYDFGRFDLPPADVFEPGGQDSHHEGPGKDIQVTTRRNFRGPKRPRKLRSIPYLTVIVRNHRPKPPEGFGGNRDPELGNIPLRNVRMKSSRHLMLLAASSARNERENPPHSQT